MTQDEIISIAREAGISSIWADASTRQLERFAALVAAHEREKLMNVAIFSKWYQELDAAVLAEREACAKVCDTEDVHRGHWYAAAIRNRSNK